MQFRNYYRCAECGCEWTDVWSAQCDDDCPFCGARHMSPYKSEDITEDLPSVVEIEDALSGALSDLEAWAHTGPEGMTSEERIRFESYERVLERLSGRGPCKSEDVEEGGDE
jgi:predicted  nucleic acid-binding Zn-ribbon protein